MAEKLTMAERMRQDNEAYKAENPTGANKETEAPKAATDKPTSTTEQPKAPVEQAAVEINDEAVLSYLSEKQGKTFTSIDDVFKQPEANFASEEVARLNKYTAETGRGVQDFLKLQEDHSSKDPISILRESYLSSGGDAESFDLEYDLDLQPLNTEDGHTEDEVSARDREIRKRDLRIKKESQSALTKLNEFRETFNKPVEGYVDPTKRASENSERWMSDVQKATSDFDLGIEGYVHNATPEDLTERYSSIDKVMSQFKGEDGNFNHSNLIKALELYRNYDTIKDVIGKQSAVKAEEDVIKSIESPDANLKTNSIESEDSEDTAMRNKLKKYR